MADREKASSNEVYQDKEYWESRYQEEEEYEWCCEVKQWSALFEAIVPKQSKLLILGCGNSSMSADLYSLGYIDITNIDYSTTVIARMEERFSHLQGMRWLTMDLFDLQFLENEFDCVIEKCTLEVLFVKEKDPWNPSKPALDNLHAAMSQVSKVLRPGGLFISISFTQPHFRLPLLRSVCPTWSCEYKTFGEGFHYFFFICTKPLLSL